MRRDNGSLTADKPVMARFDGPLSGAKTVRIRGTLQGGPAGGKPYIEFSARGEVRLILDAGGQLRLESRGESTRTFAALGREAAVAPGERVAFDIVLDGPRVECRVRGQTLYVGEHAMETRDSSLTLHLNCREVVGSGEIAIFDELRVDVDVAADSGAGTAAPPGPD